MVPVQEGTKLRLTQSFQYYQDMSNVLGIILYHFGRGRCKETPRKGVIIVFFFFLYLATIPDFSVLPWDWRMGIGIQGYRGFLYINRCIYKCVPC